MRIVSEQERSISFSKDEMRLIRMALSWVVDRLDKDEIAVLSGVRAVDPITVLKDFRRIDDQVNPPIS